MENREAALRALARYRSGAAARGQAAACLEQRARRFQQLDGHERRRSEVVERTVAEAGLERGEAEQAYDLAREEGLDPALALELLCCGVLVRGPADAEPTPQRRDTELEEMPPEWLQGPPPPAEDARRERRLRASFRRLRVLLEQRGTPEEALIAFAEEPDIGRMD
jgi:hypothetical protein